MNGDRLSFCHVYIYHKQFICGYLNRWYNGEIYVVVINFRDESYTVDLSYFDNVVGDVEVILNSIQSPKSVG